MTLPARDLAPAPMPRRGITRIEPVRDLAALDALRPHWDDLLRASRAATPFLTWEWLSAWWTHLRGAAELRALALWSDDRLVGVVPWMLKSRALRALSRLEFLGTGHAGADYLDLLVRHGYESDALAVAAEQAARERLTLRLDHVLEASLARQLASNLQGRGWTVTLAPNGVCPVINLAGHSWDSYLSTLGASHRANVRRRLRAIEKAASVSFEPVTTDDQRRGALAALFAYHDWRFDEDGGSTAFFTPALRAFHDDVTRRALEAGWLRMYTLRLDGAPAAVMYGFRLNGRFSFYQHGFDRAYRQHSLGLVLMARTIRAAIDEGAHTFDMLWGEESYKWLWARRALHLIRVHVYPPDAGGRLHRGVVETRRRLAPLARRVLTPGDSRAV